MRMYRRRGNSIACVQPYLELHVAHNCGQYPLTLHSQQVQPSSAQACPKAVKTAVQKAAKSSREAAEKQNRSRTEAAAQRKEKILQTCLALMKRPWPISVPEHVTRTEPSAHKCTKQGLPLEKQEWNLQCQGKGHYGSSGSCSNLLGFGEEALAHLCASAGDQDSAVRVQVDQAGAGPRSPSQHRLESAPHMVCHMDLKLCQNLAEMDNDQSRSHCWAERQPENDGCPLSNCTPPPQARTAQQNNGVESGVQSSQHE